MSEFSARPDESAIAFQTPGVETLKKADLLSIRNPEHRRQAVDALHEGAVIAAAFNGVFALMAHGDNAEAAERIVEIKNRPADKKLVSVTDPRHLGETVDLSRVNYTHDQLIGLQTEVHALGLILPASETAPSHLVSHSETPTIVSIYTQYEPLQELQETFRAKGGRIFTATSANKSGGGTHFDAEDLYNDLGNDVPLILGDDFSHLDEFRRRSTSMLDLTGKQPIFHREGNVTADELRPVLQRHNFPDLVIPEERIIVKPR